MLSRDLASPLVASGFERHSEIMRQFGSGGAYEASDPMGRPRLTPALLAAARAMARGAPSRLRARSGSPHEASIGFSRAIRVGNRILVSETAPVEDDGRSTPGDAEVQAERCLAVIVGAIEALGGRVENVVRMRMLLTDAADAAADADAVGRVHGRWFGTVRPAATMAVVAALLRPEWRVEIEAEAVLDEPT